MPGLLTSTDVAIVDQIIKDPSVRSAIQEQRADVTQLLNEQDMTVELAAQTVGHIMRYGDSDSSKLAAARLTFQAHKILDQDGDLAQAANRPVINFNFNDSNVNLNGVFCPVRDARDASTVDQQSS